MGAVENKSTDTLWSIRDGLRRPGEVVFRTGAKAVVVNHAGYSIPIWIKNCSFKSVGREVAGEDDLGGTLLGALSIASALAPDEVIIFYLWFLIQQML